MKTFRHPVCVKLWSESFDGKLCCRGFDSPKFREKPNEFVERMRVSVGLDKYTTLVCHRWIMDQYGIADVQLVFCEPKAWTGRVDGTIESVKHATYEQAVDWINEREKVDPKGVATGEYYIDFDEGEE